jgi:hypothetical protein
MYLKIFKQKMNIMKKLILGLAILVLFGCNQKTPKEKNQNKNEITNNSDKNNSTTDEIHNSEYSDSNVDNATKEDIPRSNFFDSDEVRNDLPASKYFKIDKINFSRFIKDGKFELDFNLLNNTDYKFSSVNFHADIFSKMKNNDEICQSTIQFDDWQPHSTINYVPHHIWNWEPQTVKHVYFIGSPCIRSFERTPEVLTLVIKISSAISIDSEVEGVFAKYDLLNLWKEQQVKEGLR